MSNDVPPDTISPLVAPSIGLPVRLPHQTQLFSRKALIEFPQKEISADSLGEVEADDLHRYYIKGDAHGRSIRASEWVCAHISEAVGIAAPSQAVIELGDGSEVFGSRRIANVSDAVITNAFLMQPSQQNQETVSSGLGTILSSIYALDMFVNNVDRHFGNYLSNDDNGTRRLYAFDFSRALFWNWPLQEFPQIGENTRACGEILRNFHGFDQTSAFNTLNRLSGLAPNTIEGFINAMPSNWLPTEVSVQFVEWWASSEKEKRIAKLRAGIIDGTLL